jgi:hypothetical protein
MPTTQERARREGLEQDEREARGVLVGERVLHALGEPGDLLKVQVRELWEDHYRVNVFTDGVAEAFSPEGPLFGMGRALGSVRAHRRRTSGEVVAAHFHEVRAFSQGLQTDDMTAVVIEVSDA